MFHEEKIKLGYTGSVNYGYSLLQKKMEWSRGEWRGGLGIGGGDPVTLLGFPVSVCWKVLFNIQ